ncbi:MAG TPA: FHIPEP family type III secretion protein [Candidatus Xenobia bacterium]
MKSIKPVWLGAFAAPGLALLSLSSGNDLGWPVAALWLGLLAYNVGQHWMGRSQPVRVQETVPSAGPPPGTSPDPSPPKPVTYSVLEQSWDSLRQAPLAVELAPPLFKTFAVGPAVSLAVVSGVQKKFGFKLHPVRFELNAKLEENQFRILIWDGLAGQGRFYRDQICTLDPSRLGEADGQAWRPACERTQAVREGLLVLDLPQLLTQQLAEIASAFPHELWKLWNTIHEVETLSRTYPAVAGLAVRMKVTGIHQALVERLRLGHSLADLPALLAKMAELPVETITPEEVARRLRCWKPATAATTGVAAPGPVTGLDDDLRAAWLFSWLWHPYYREKICRKLSLAQEERLCRALLRLTRLSDPTTAALRQWVQNEVDGAQDPEDEYARRIAGLLGDQASERPPEQRVALLLLCLPEELATPVLQHLMDTLTAGPRRDLLVCLGSALRPGHRPNPTVLEHEATEFLARLAEATPRDAPLPTVAPVELLVRDHVGLVAAWVQAEWLSSRSGLEELRRQATFQPQRLATGLARELALVRPARGLSGPEKAALLLEELPPDLREELQSHLVLTDLQRTAASTAARQRIRQELLVGWSALHPTLNYSPQ